MQNITMQKNDIRQVICEKCGNLCDFECDKCPACGASLFGHEPPNEEDKKGESKRPDLSSTNETKPSKIKVDKGSIAIILAIVIFYTLLFLMAYGLY